MVTINSKKPSFIEKKLLPIITILILAWPSACFSFYLIELKTGVTIKTDRYWENEDEILYNFSGGVAAVGKEAIQSIMETDEPLEETVPTAGEQEAAPTPAPKAPDTANTDTDEDKTVNDFKGLKKRFKDVDELETEALYKLAEDLTLWRNKIVADGSGNQYTGQLMEMDDMFTKIEDTIIEKDQ